MRIIRNWVLPALIAVTFGLAGVIVVGLPGVEVVQTWDSGSEPGSYLVFYGVKLYGRPFYWFLTIIVVPALFGFKLGRRW